MSPISSRKIVPPLACSKRPGLSATAPVNAPCTWPNSSDSISSSGIAAQLTSTNGPLRRRLDGVDACAPPAPCRCRSRRRSARGRWSARPSRPARAGAASPRSRRPSTCWRSTRARSARFSASRSRCRSALRTTSTVFSSDSGFSTKSNAPILIARTADSMLPWPEMIDHLRVDLPLAQPLQRRRARRCPAARRRGR